MEKIAISSTKGGVGKTSFTLMLSQYLKKNGLKIGILDADIYGPNILANRDHKISSTDAQSKFLPINQGGIEVSSISLIINDSEAAIWRGPMLSQAIKALHDNTNWSDLDYLLIDMPPGTGDAYLTVFQSLDVKKSLLVQCFDLIQFRIFSKVRCHSEVRCYKRSGASIKLGAFRKLGAASSMECHPNVLYYSKLEYRSKMTLPLSNKGLRYLNIRKRRISSTS